MELADLVMAVSGSGGRIGSPSDIGARPAIVFVGVF